MRINFRLPQWQDAVSLRGGIRAGPAVNVQRHRVIHEEPHLAALSAAMLATAAPLPAALPFAATPALAQSALSFEKPERLGRSGSLRIPRIIIEGTNATRADIEALFDPKQRRRRPNGCAG